MKYNCWQCGGKLIRQPNIVENHIVYLCEKCGIPIYEGIKENR